LNNYLNVFDLQRLLHANPDMCRSQLNSGEILLARTATTWLLERGVLYSRLAGLRRLQRGFANESQFVVTSNYRPSNLLPLVEELTVALPAFRSNNSVRGPAGMVK
jgi:hypothetical protein